MEAAACLQALPDRAVRALVYDSHETSRLGLAVLLERQPWVGRCLLAATQLEAVELVRRHRPAVAVVDVSDTGPFVAPVIAALREVHAGLRVVLTARCAAYARGNLRQLGAVAFHPPEGTGDELADTVRAAVLDQPSPRHAEPVRDDELPVLTLRESEVLSLISTGATNREIAAALHLAPDSIKKHAASIYRKLGVRNRTDATRRVAELVPSAAGS